MKRLAYCGAGLAVLSIVFSASYYFSYKKALENFNNSAIAQNLGILEKLEQASKEGIEVQDGGLEETDSFLNSVIYSDGTQIDPAPESTEPQVNVGMSGISWQPDEEQASETKGGTVEDGQDAETASTAEEDRVKPSTVYLLETYDLCRKTVLREELKPPADFIGLSREELTRYLTGYMENMPLKEYADGLISYELVSFSKKEFTIRKTYNEELVPNKFYLAIRGGLVVIYYSDMSTVYEYTDIQAMELSEEERIKLINGYYVKDLDELYSVLEAYTS